MLTLLNYPELKLGQIIKRPSKVCKTPYVADTVFFDQDDENQGEINEFQSHTPALGCCGLCEKDSVVLLNKIDEKKNKKSVCSYRVELAVLDLKNDKNHKDFENLNIINTRKICVGINPKLAETIVEKCIQNNLIKNLTNVIKYAREVKYLNSRFDFSGLDENGMPFVLEVKNVPLADFIDVPKKERKKTFKLIEEENKKNNKPNQFDFNDKIAYFPDGFRKNTKVVVSERALKHVNELEELTLSKKIRAILCFVIQRPDVKYFQTSNIDQIYKEAVYKAHQNGVEITTVQIEWNENGECKFIRNDLPISLKNGEFI